MLLIIQDKELFHCEFCSLDSGKVDGDRAITIVEDMEAKHTRKMQVCHFYFASETFQFYLPSFSPAGLFIKARRKPLRPGEGKRDLESRAGGRDIDGSGGVNLTSLAGKLAWGRRIPRKN